MLIKFSQMVWLFYLIHLAAEKKTKKTKKISHMNVRHRPMIVLIEQLYEAGGCILYKNSIVF